VARSGGPRAGRKRHARSGDRGGAARPRGRGQPHARIRLGRGLPPQEAEDPAHRAILSEALRSLTGGRWKLSFELREVAEGQGAEGEGVHSEEELLRRFIEEFDAEEIPGDLKQSAGGEHADPQAGVAGANEQEV